MSKRPFIVFGLLAAVCLIVLPIVALGKEGDEDAGTVKVADQDRAAQDLIATNCGACHTLAAAGTDGVVGPNLDELLVTSGENSPEQFETNYSRVIAAIDCGLNGRMPKGILEAAEAEEAAAFVAAYAGQIGKGPTVDIATVDKPAATGCPGGASGGTG